MHNQIKISNSLKFILISFMLFLGNVAFAATYNVNSISALETTVASAQPGDTVVLANGTYSDKDCVLSGEGVTVEAETIGGVIFHRPVTINGDSITLKGFYFTGANGMIEVYSNNVKVTRCTIDDSQATAWVRIQNYTRNCEFSYNTFKNKTNNASIDKGMLFNVNKHKDETTPSNHHIHHNHFKNVLPISDGNGGECIQMWTDGSTSNGDYGIDTGNVIEYNLFEHVDGEIELYSDKSNGNTFHGNVIFESKGAITLRESQRAVVSNNYIISNGVYSAGIRVFRDDHTIINNFIYQVAGAGIELGSGDGGLYSEANNAVVAFNTIIECQSGIRTGRTPTDTQPANIMVENNVIADSTLQAFRIGTTLSNATFSANYVQGNVGDNPGGVTNVPLLLKKQSNGVYVPELGSPVIDKAVGNYSTLLTDIQGTKRLSTKTVGATRVPDSTTLDTVLISAMVGAQVTEEPIASVTEPVTEPVSGPFVISSSGLK